MRRMLLLRLKHAVIGIIVLSYCYLLVSFFGVTPRQFFRLREIPRKCTQDSVKADVGLLNLKQHGDSEKTKQEPHLEPVLVPKEATIKVHGNSSKKTSSVDTYEHRLQWGFPMNGSIQAPKPSFKLGKISGPTDFIIGITSVKRELKDYLPDTLKSLVQNRKATAGTFKIVVFLGETDEEYVQQRSKQLLNIFEDEINSGRLEIISPPKHYYPNWDVAITTTLNDKLERVKWRSKENLDAVFIMMYIYQLSPKYYLMLEDDVSSDRGYDQFIIDNTKRMEGKDWFFLSYCGWCSIGKLFQRDTIVSFASFVHMFWNKKPIDWLQRDYVKSAFCNEELDLSHCNREMLKWMPPMKPYVFHHIGKYDFLRIKKGKQYIQIITSQAFDGPHRSSTSDGQLLIHNEHSRTPQLLRHFYGEPDTTRLLRINNPGGRGRYVNEASDTGICIVCMDKQTKVIIRPCRHFCCCYQCALKMVNCPCC